MTVIVKKNSAAVSLGWKRGKKGGPARAAKLNAKERSESAGKAVRARWEKVSESASAAVILETSKKALHLCLKRIKAAKNDTELRRPTEDLQRIVFNRQYQNAENREAAALLSETSRRSLS